MKFKIFGVKIYVSFFFSAFVSLLIATDRTGLIIPALFAVLIHEAGHLFAMWTGDCAPKEIRLIPASVQIIESYPRSVKSEVWISLSGPLANIAVGSALLVNFYIGGAELSLRFALINLVYGFFNLLPVSGLDGGRLTVAALSRRGDILKAINTVRIITALIAVLMLSVGIYLAVTGKFNLSLFILALYFALCAILKC